MESEAVKRIQVKRLRLGQGVEKNEITVFYDYLAAGKLATITDNFNLDVKEELEAFDLWIKRRYYMETNFKTFEQFGARVAIGNLLKYPNLKKTIAIEINDRGDIVNEIFIDEPETF